MKRVVLIVISLLLAGPATAHGMRLFARVEGGQVSGYAFFIGGGRPAGVNWVARMAGDTIASGTTDPEGAYSFAVPEAVTGNVSVTVDTGEGHIATTELPASRFTQGGGATASAASDSAPPPAAAASSDATSRLVEEAVARQVGPLLERIEAMDARMRLTDALSGIFLIAGLAGMALWARGRRR